MPPGEGGITSNVVLGGHRPFRVVMITTGRESQHDVGFPVGLGSVPSQVSTAVVHHLPVPVSTTLGLFVALLMIDSVLSINPGDVGLKVTLIRHVLPLATGVAQVPSDTLKGAGASTPVMMSGALPVLRTTIVRAD